MLILLAEVEVEVQAKMIHRQDLTMVRGERKGKVGIGG